MKEKMVVCRWGRCRHDDKKMKIGDAVKSGTSMYYHPDCFKEKECIRKILELYKNHIDDTPIWAQVMRIVTTIIYDHHIAPEYLLFALEFAVKNEIKIWHPPGLYYLVKRRDIADAWKKQEKRKVIDFGEVPDLEVQEGYNTKSGGGFMRILGK